MAPLPKEGYTFDNAISLTQDQNDKLSEAHSSMMRFVNNMHDVFDSTRIAIAQSPDVTEDDRKLWIAKLSELEGQFRGGVEAMNTREFVEDFQYLYGDIQQWFED